MDRLMTESHSSPDRFLERVVQGSDLVGFDYTLSGFRLYLERVSTGRSNLPLQAVIQFDGSALVDGEQASTEEQCDDAVVRMLVWARYNANTVTTAHVQSSDLILRLGERTLRVVGGAIPEGGDWVVFDKESTGMNWSCSCEFGQVSTRMPTQALSDCTSF